MVCKQRKKTVDVPASKMIGSILDIVKRCEYIEDFRLMKTNTQGVYKIYLKYDQKKPAIIGLKRISKPGLRVYKRSNDISRVLNGLGIAVVSTSKGIITDNDARQQKIGGEILCHIW